MELVLNLDKNLTEFHRLALTKFYQERHNKKAQENLKIVHKTINLSIK